MFLKRSKTAKSNKLSEYNIVQYSIWLVGNTKLIKKMKKQNRKAKNFWVLVKSCFSFCLNPPDKLEWYFAFFLDKFSNIKRAKINNNKKNEIWFANARSSNVIQEFYIPVLSVFIEKKSTAPNSANVSIDTKDKPAIIAGRADGNIIVKKDFIFENPRFLPRSIKFWDW